ncbi:MAG: glycosyltransferase family 4 protein [Phycisphaerales bacterium]|nr:glycosyltransferase family 4 protein [Phycisphaerales bacterium]
MIPRCARTVALTPSEAEAHRRLGAVGAEVIGCGIPDGWGRDADGARIRRRHGIGEQPVIGFVGRQDEGKGAPTLVRAMQLVWRQRPEALLMLAGPRSHRDPAAEAALAALAPGERGRVVEVSDFPDADAPDVFAACDLLAQPSVEESFGIVLTEAWMVGRPVIGASIPATRDLVSDGEDGLIVPPSDPARLAEAIDALLACPRTRARMGAAGKAKVLSRYTVKAMTDAWESMLVDVVDGRKRAKGLEPSTFSLGS